MATAIGAASALVKFLRQEASLLGAPAFNLAGTGCCDALKYVSFPAQMVGKSFMMRSVLIWVLAVGGKSYKVIRWCFAFLEALHGFSSRSVEVFCIL